jgi:hypothetical protein
VPTWSKALEGNTVDIVNARCRQTLRGRRPYTCVETLGTGMMNGCRKSDLFVVPKKFSNNPDNVGAEKMEGRDKLKENEC